MHKKQINNAEQHTEEAHEQAQRPLWPHKLISGGPLLSRAKFKNSHLLIAFAIFAFIGVVTLVGSFAFNGSNGDFEAETMTVVSP